MKSRTFTFADQIAFAKLSGDCNSLHINPVASRRLLFGSSIVHGIHAMLWGLDSWLKDVSCNVKFRSVKAVFRKPIRIDEEVQLFLENEGDRHFRIELKSNESVASIIVVEWDKSVRKDSKDLVQGFPERQQPRNLSKDELEGMSGTLDLCLNVEDATRTFPHLLRCLSPMEVAVILGTTRLVGNECPGKNSVYSELKFSSCDSQESTSLKYEVVKFDRRFDLVLIKITAPGITGTIKAFIRPTHQEQPSYLDMIKLVESGEFVRQRALIIGGSRGLGEVSAKLLAAGGAEVRLTYNQGVEDAKQIVEEIETNGGTADCLQFNVLSPEQSLLKQLLNHWYPTHLYYFATPFIFSAIRGKFSSKLFKKFCDYYITGFLNTVNLLKNESLMTIFYPSTMAIDELPSDMGEYAAAKMASEMLCLFLEKNHKDLTIYKPRLPRVSTDQTVCLLPVENQDSVKVMLQHLRQLRDNTIL